MRAITRCGEPWVREITQQAFATERDGGMMTKDGVRYHRAAYFLVGSKPVGSRA